MKPAKIVLIAVMTILVIGLIVGCSKKEEAGAPASKQAVEQPPIKIGAVFSVTGAGAKLGGQEKNTALMIQDEVNAAGGINGRKIQVIIEDDESNEENTQKAVTKLITSDEVVAIIGPTRSGSGFAAAPICEEAGVPLLSCAAAWIQLFMDRKTSNPMYKYVFKTPQNDSQCARNIFADCQKKGYKRIAIITGTDGFGAAGRQELLAAAKDFGLQIVADETYPPDASDLTPILTKIKSAKPQALINWSIVEAQRLLPAQVKQVNLKVQLYQSHGFGNPANITPAAEGLLFPAGRLLILDDLDKSNPQYAVLSKFKSDYETKYGENVSTFAGHAYDALWLIINAIKAGGADRNSIRSGVESTKGFVGTAGIFNMSPTDHCGLSDDAFVMITVKDGKFRLAEAVK